MIYGTAVPSASGKAPLTENIDSGGLILMGYVAIEDALNFPIRWKSIIKITCRAFAQAGDFLIS